MYFTIKILYNQFRKYSCIGKNIEKYFSFKNFSPEVLIKIYLTLLLLKNINSVHPFPILRNQNLSVYVLSNNFFFDSRLFNVTEDASYEKHAK